MVNDPLPSFRHPTCLTLVAKVLPLLPRVVVVRAASTDGNRSVVSVCPCARRVTFERRGVLQVRPRRREAGQILRGGREAGGEEEGVAGEAGQAEQGQRGHGQYSGALPLSLCTKTVPCLTADMFVVP